MAKTKENKEIDSLTAKTAEKLLQGTGAEKKETKREASKAEAVKKKAVSEKKAVAKKKTAPKTKAVAKKKEASGTPVKNGVIVGGTKVESHLICQIPTYLL